tara:strand:+ start:4501 stop:4830 length:330 start_codon:yes stop_codon:yes gene_type:complete
MGWFRGCACFFLGHRWALGDDFKYKNISVKEGRKARWHCDRCGHAKVCYFPPVHSWDLSWLDHLRGTFAKFHLMRKMFRKEILYRISKSKKRKEKKRVVINRENGDNHA